LVARSS